LIFQIYQRTQMRENQYNKFIGNTVFVKDGEPIERALRKFKKKVQDSVPVSFMRNPLPSANVKNLPQRIVGKKN